MRRSEFSNVLDDSDAKFLVAGCVGSLLLGLSALPTALLDGRSVWTDRFPAVHCWSPVGGHHATVGRQDRGFRSVMSPPGGSSPGRSSSGSPLRSYSPVPVVTPALEDDYETAFSRQFLTTRTVDSRGSRAGGNSVGSTSAGWCSCGSTGQNLSSISSDDYWSSFVGRDIRDHDDGSGIW